VYYELQGIYQNHINYINSRSQQQLIGDQLKIKALKASCKPIVTFLQLQEFKNEYMGVDVKLLNNSIPNNPKNSLLILVE